VNGKLFYWSAYVKKTKKGVNWSPLLIIVSSLVD